MVERRGKRHATRLATLLEIHAHSETTLFTVAKMFSDSEDDTLLNNSALKLLLLQGYREYAVHAINKARRKHGQYHTLFMKLKKHPEKFFQYLRMDISTFNYILEKVTPYVTKKWKNFEHQPIQAEERLVVTLRYMATGESFRSLSFTFRMGATTVGMIVKETVDSLWTALQPEHMPIPTMKMFCDISNDYHNIWNFPNCIGAIDGKHVRIICPKHSGSMYWNYKQYFSIVLKGVCDANYKFIIIDVGGYGRQSDGGTFQSSNMYKMMCQKTLQIPQDRCLPKTDIKMPFVFIADEAYPLQTHILKPYSRNELNPEKKYFNQRLSRARKTIECSFGILYSKWRILSKAIETNEVTANKIIKAVCILHNVIIDREGFERHLKEISEEFRDNVFERIIRPRGRVADGGKFVRDTFKDYVNAFPISYKD